ncbi:MAG: wax ester/triacylglycerol synthase domain-containing protein [Betaproteobacteria bacterium]
MHHLSALDALFLQLETAEVPAHVGSVSLLKKPPGHRGSFYPHIRKHIESRLHLAPLFSRRLAFMPLDLASPIWLGGSAVNLDDHITRVVLPKPGTPEQLDDAVAKLHEGMMDRDRPLWQFTVIEGLQDGNVAFYSRIHHAALDGQGGVALAHAILDTSARPRAVEPPGGNAKHAKPRLPPTTAKMLGAAFRHTVAQYTRIVKAVPDALRMAGAAGAELLSSSQAKHAGAPSEQGTGFGHLADFKPGESLQKVARTLLKKIPGGISLGPRTSLNVAISGERAFAGVALPLAETKAIASHFDTKLNDIELAVCAGALRRYFAGDKAALSKAMIGGVPASLRMPGDNSQSNQVTMMLISMATNIADPRKRLAAIVKASTKAKGLTGSMKKMIPVDLPSLGIPWLMSVITPLYRTAVASNRIPVVANLVVSNVPGPQMPLYLAGAELITYYPVSIVTHGLALNITIQSYAGTLYYGLIACKEAVPDLREFADHLRAAHQELVALAREPQTSAKKRLAGKRAPAKVAGKPSGKPAGGKTASGRPPAGRTAVKKAVVTRTSGKQAAGGKTLRERIATTRSATGKLTAAKVKAKKKRA